MVYGIGFYEGSSDCLSHHGIKGMHWGVRRTKAQLSRAQGERLKKTAKKSHASNEEDVNEPHTQIGHRRAKDMSDEELAAAVKRLQTEKQYKDLMADARGTKIHVNTKKIINDALEQSMKNVATNALTQVGSLALASAVNKVTGKTILDKKEVRTLAEVAAEKAARQKAQQTEDKPKDEPKEEPKDEPKDDKKKKKKEREKK